MWAMISKILLQIVTSIISEKVLVQGAKLMISKAVDSKAEDIGINDKDARDIISTVTSSTLNTLEDQMSDYLGI